MSSPDAFRSAWYLGIRGEKTAFYLGANLGDREKTAEVEPDYAGAAALGLGGGYAAVKSVDPLIGNTRMYHGTFDPAVYKSIREKGFLRSAGGTGASRAMNSTAAKGLQGSIHLTPWKMKARAYAGFDPSKGHATEFLRANLKALNPLAAENKRVISVDLPDPVARRMIEDPGDFAAKMITHQDLPPEMLNRSRLSVLRERLPEIPAYARKNPTRFAAGVGGVGLAGGLLGAGYKKLQGEELSDSETAALGGLGLAVPGGWALGYGTTTMGPNVRRLEGEVQQLQAPIDEIEKVMRGGIPLEEVPQWEDKFQRAQSALRAPKSRLSVLSGKKKILQGLGGVGLLGGLGLAGYGIYQGLQGAEGS